MRRDLPSGTVTFLFTDVEGSTKLLHSLGAEAYAGALAEHRASIRAACSAEGGVEVDTQGDAFFFAFPSTKGALAAAQAFTEALASGPIQVRVGLHTGTPLVTEEGYVGDDVHFAARVAATAHGGQVVCSAATATLVDSPLTSLGSHRLKDIAEPVSLYQLGDGSFPPLKTIANTNLPTPASSFLGREEELYAADALLHSTRLLTISGPGGQGKTRFALELATRAREERFSDYRDGVFACFLSSLRDPSLVLPTLCQTLNVHEQPGTSALEALSGHLQGKKLMLLLDNAEHLLASAHELSQLLQQVSGLTLLVTSRELLRIQGETPYTLPPLRDDQSVALFCERARLEPSPEIAELCARLEGLPLALELAAARTAILTPAQLRERLSQRLDLLKAGRDADPRQATLRATIEWSYGLLSEEEQQLFARLSVFAGGCTLEAAEAVCGADLDGLQSLVDKSLLRFSEERHWMLETIREYAAERLEERGEAEVVRERHSEWFTSFAERAEPELERAEQAEWLERLSVAHDNMRQALKFGLERRDSELTHRLAGSMATFWWVQGHVVEGSGWLTRVLQFPAPIDEVLRAKVLEGCAHLIVRQPDHARAKDLAEASSALYRRLGNASGEARAVRVLALSAVRDGDNNSFRALTEESAALARQSGDEWVLAMALNNLGNLALIENEVDRGMSLLEHALVLARGRGDRRTECFVLENVAVAQLMADDVDGAHSSFAESLRIAHSLGFVELVVEDLVGLALLASESGDIDRAARILGGAGHLRTQIGLWSDVLEERLNAAALTSIEHALGRERCEAALRSGEDLSLAQLVSLALETGQPAVRGK
jgi:predicted ATPase/class 3 adenylate cyclase